MTKKRSLFSRLDLISIYIAWKELKIFASEASERFPQQLFFYYVSAKLASSKKEYHVALRSAKKGLERYDKRSTGRFILFATRSLTGRCAAELGFVTFSGTVPYPEDGINPQKAQAQAEEWWGQCCAFWTSAYQDLKCAVNENTGCLTNGLDLLFESIYWYTFILFGLKGDQISDDLEELTVIFGCLSYSIVLLITLINLRKLLTS